MLTRTEQTIDLVIDSARILQRIAIEQGETVETPIPNIERIPKTFDGCTWYAWATKPDGTVIGATSRTKRDLIPAFNEQWNRFANSDETIIREVFW